LARYRGLESRNLLTTVLKTVSLLRVPACRDRYDLENRSPMLSTWKDIAEYLGKGIRTAQRWSDEAGLPVHRDRTTVYAFRAEIDAWIYGPPRGAEKDVEIDTPKLCDSAYRLRIAVTRLYLTAEQMLELRNHEEHRQATLGM
jgi:phage terminase Nu1 subunit (DNA packaging protein)